MPNRNIYDWSTYVATCGALGHLQTVGEPIPVIAGSSVKIDFLAAFKLSELKRWITLDAKIDLHAFFVSHRSVYGDSWETMIKEGLEQASATVLPTVDTSGAEACQYMGTMSATGSTPKAYATGYMMIWNEFFRVPNVEERQSDTFVPNATTQINNRRHGLRCARLPQYWNTGANSTNMDATDFAEVGLSAGSGQVNLLDIATVQAEYRDQVDKEWFSHRYRDVLEYAWGSNGVKIDSDERPQLLWSQEQWSSGYNIDGTSGDSLGVLGGRVESMVQLRMPTKYFNEHGMIWVMAVVRFPSLIQGEQHYLKGHAWDYPTIAGDPNLALTTPPEDLTLADFVPDASNGTLDMGRHPSYQYWRTMPSCSVKRSFWDKEGFPFIDTDQLSTAPGTDSDVTYHDAADLWDPTEEDDFFTNRELGHWNMIGKMEIECRNVIPEATKSLYTGAHLR